MRPLTSTYQYGPLSHLLPVFRRVGLCLLLIFGAIGFVSAQQPSVVGSFPRNGDHNLLRNLFISVRISLPEEGQEVDPESFTAENVRLYPSGSSLTPIDCWLRISNELKNITVQPKEILAANTTYIFEITSGLQDNRGLPFKPYRSVFRTGAIGLDKPATAPPGYASDSREFAFKMEEQKDPPRREPDYTDLVNEQDELLDHYDEDEGDGGFLVDIDALMEEEEDVGEIPSYLPDELDPDDSELLVEFDEEEELYEDEDLYTEEEPEPLIEDIIPEVVVNAKTAEDEDYDMSDMLVDIDMEEDLEEELDMPAEEKAVTRDAPRPSTDAQPGMGYIMPVRAFRDQMGRTRDEEVMQTEFLDFMLEFKDEGFVEIRWEMASEFQNEFFSIERSLDGNSFSVVDTVHSLSDGKKALNYLRTDTEAEPGMHYYRVAYHTRKGEMGYTGVQEVLVKEKEHIRFGKTAIFPNAKLPLEFRLNESRKVTVLITTDKGRPVKRISGTIGPGTTQKAINMQGVPSGKYVAVIDATSMRTRRQITVLR